MTTTQLGKPVGKPLPFNDNRHLQAHQFLVDEAYLLDAQQYETWLDTLTDDIRYLMPVRVTTALGAGFDTSPGMAHFDEDKYSLSRRVARFATEHAWTEDPPSRMRHYITNVRTFACDDDAHLFVESAELLFRSRGDVNEAALVSCGRQDVLRRCGDHRSTEIGPPHHPGRRVGLEDAELGGVPVNDALTELLNGAVGEPLTVANEFTEVVVRRVDTRNGSRLLISAPKSGRWISLDALEVEALTRQNARTLAAMVGNSGGPLLPDERWPTVTRWLDGKRALVVGGGSGIGRAVVDAFRDEGAKVAVLERDPDKCDTLRHKLKKVPVVEGDATTRAANDLAVATAVEAFDGLDTLVNCVGIFDFYKGIGDIDADDLPAAFDEMFRTNVLSHLQSVKAAVPALQAETGSSIVLTESASSFYPGRGGALYVSSKFAVRGLVSRAGSRTRAADPGQRRGTGRHAEHRPTRSCQPSDWTMPRLDDTPNRARDLAARTPLNVALTGEDHAWSFVFLASDRSRGITGETLHPDGGFGIGAAKSAQE